MDFEFGSNVVGVIVGDSFFSFVHYNNPQAASEIYTPHKKAVLRGDSCFCCRNVFFARMGVYDFCTFFDANSIYAYITV